MMVELKKIEGFIFENHLNWKMYEKFLKKEMGEVGSALRRRKLIAIVRRYLNDNKIRFISKGDIGKVSELLSPLPQNEFEKKAVQYFITFIQKYLT